MNTEEGTSFSPNLREKRVNGRSNGRIVCQRKGASRGITRISSCRMLQIIAWFHQDKYSATKRRLRALLIAPATLLEQPGSISQRKTYLDSTCDTQLVQSFHCFQGALVFCAMVSVTEDLIHRHDVVGDVRQHPPQFLGLRSIGLAGIKFVCILHTFQANDAIVCSAVLAMH